MNFDDTLALVAHIARLMRKLKDDPLPFRWSRKKGVRRLVIEGEVRWEDA